jgi:hypothetical protein
MGAFQSNLAPPTDIDIKQALEARIVAIQNEPKARVVPIEDEKRAIEAARQNEERARVVPIDDEKTVAARMAAEAAQNANLARKFGL